MDKITNRWTKIATKKLVGRKIVKVEYMSTEEIENNMWSNRPICFLLDNGAWVYPMRDDEGNDGGVLYYNGTDSDDATLLPVI